MSGSISTTTTVTRGWSHSKLIYLTYHFIKGDVVSSASPILANHFTRKNLQLSKKTANKTGAGDAETMYFSTTDMPVLSL
ncbi:MAG: hypothetical protein ISR69_09375 [Gammaproteobacteria bacterium]|nr:hypothetical protein [Gammaproteobacteria bacterium]